MMETTGKLLSHSIDSDLVDDLLEYCQELEHRFSLG
jgi:hypothetical protein